MKIRLQGPRADFRLLDKSPQSLRSFAVNAASTRSVSASQSLPAKVKVPAKALRRFESSSCCSLRRARTRRAFTISLGICSASAVSSTLKPSTAEHRNNPESLGQFRDSGLKQVRHLSARVNLRRVHGMGICHGFSSRSATNSSYSSGPLLRGGCHIFANSTRSSVSNTSFTNTELSGRWMKLPSSGLLMSDAKLFHHVLGVAQMVLEYLQTVL